jgi:hypothetical protein
MADEELEYPERGYTTKDVRAVRDELPPSRRRRRWPWILLLAIVIAPAALLGLWAAITMNYTYSSGNRVGYVQKFSKKGWLCKTWEGELAMATSPGVAPQIFPFSVRNDSIAAAIQQIMQTQDGRISLTYEEHRGVPTSCFGETDYFVSGAQPVGPAATPTLPGAVTPPAGAGPTATPAPAVPATPTPRP